MSELGIYRFFFISIFFYGVFLQTKAERSPLGPSDPGFTDSLLYQDYSSKLLQHYPAYIDSSIYYVTKRLELAIANGKRMEEGINLGSLAFIYMNSGQYRLSLENYLAANEVLTDPGNELHFWNLSHGKNPRDQRLRILANLYFNFGHLMGVTGNHDLQMEYYHEVINIARENNDTEHLSYAYDGLAIYYLYKEQLDSVFIYSDRSIALSDHIENQKNIPFSKYIHGLILLKLGKAGDAETHFTEGLKLAETVENFPGIVINQYGLSRSAYENGMIGNSLHHGYQALNGFRIINSFDALNIHIGHAYENLYTIYKTIQQQDSATHYLLLAKEANDSIHIVKLKNLADFQHFQLSEQFRLNQLEKEQVLYRNKIRNYFLLTFLGIAFAILGFLFYFFKQKSYANLKLTKALLHLKNTQDQLIQQEKLASLGQLTAGIAHEIQNPLNFVNNFSEVSKELIDELNEELEAGSWHSAVEIANDIKQNMEKINHHGQRASSIVKGMLEHSRKSDGKKELTDINDLCDEYLRLAYHGYRAKNKTFNAKLETHFDPALPKLLSVPQDIGRVVLNIFNNAFYAINERSKNVKLADTSLGGGEMDNQKLKPEYTPTVTVSTKNLDDRIEISIKDNANGIPDHIKDKIFQPFFTTKPAGQGTGLGLSLAYDFVSAHGGELKVISKEGEGTEFIIQLPIV
ncbi:MAG TPA: ATP-binding protein [Saprospiraceae bacterium]|nr:ATP-binding protein [Saprospiraceae bacterium]